MTFRFTMLLIAVACTLIFGYALYLQHIVGMVPCPMCIVQRYAMTMVALFAVLAAILNRGRVSSFTAWFALLFALFGAFVAGRQSWLQRNPPEFMSCGRDFYGMIEQLPISRYVPLIFQGSGDCAAMDYVIGGLTVANLSLLAFVGFALLIIRALIVHKKEAANWF